MNAVTIKTNLEGEDERDSGERPRILSIQSRMLGHRTYGEMIRRYLTASPLCDVDSYWADEERSMKTRLVNRAAHHPINQAWVRRRNLDLYRYRREWGMSYLGRAMADRLLCAGQYDCVHFHTQTLGFLTGRLASRIPVVLSGDQTTAQAIASEPPVPTWTHRAHLALEKRAFHAATHLVFWSEWAARSAISDQRVSPEKVTVIHPGVDLSAFSARPTETPCDSPVRLFFVGADFVRKGGPDVLDVFLRDLAPRADRGTGPAVELHLMTGADLPDDLPRSVHVHRGVQAYSPEWLHLYQMADIFVLPTHSEAYGLVFAEAMAAGLPVVATRINAIPEIVEHGSTGFLIEPGDQAALARYLHTLIDDLNLRRRFGYAGRKKAEYCFDAAASFHHLGEVFAAAAQPTRRKRMPS